MKTSELIGHALDWAVAKCESLKESDEPYWLDGIVVAPCFLDKYHPSTDWSQGGPIIEREINTLIRCKDWCDKSVYFEARCRFDEDSVIQYGPTLLIAAMRCWVASKLGDEVEIPKELL